MPYKEAPVLPCTNKQPKRRIFPPLRIEMASMQCYKPAQKSYYQEQQEFSYSEEETTNWSLNGYRSHHGGLQGYAQKESYIESNHGHYFNNGMDKSHAEYSYRQANYPNGCNTYGNQNFGYKKAAAMAQSGQGIGQAYGHHKYKASNGMVSYHEKTKVKGEYKTGQFERINLSMSDDSCSDSDSDSDNESDDEYHWRRKHHC